LSRDNRYLKLLEQLSEDDPVEMDDKVLTSIGRLTTAYCARVVLLLILAVLDELLGVPQSDGDWTPGSTRNGVIWREAISKK